MELIMDDIRGDTPEILRRGIPRSWVRALEDTSRAKPMRELPAAVDRRRR